MTYDELKIPINVWNEWLSIWNTPSDKEPGTVVKSYHDYAQGCKYTTWSLRLIVDENGIIIFKLSLEEDRRGPVSFNVIITPSELLNGTPPFVHEDDFDKTVYAVKVVPDTVPCLPFRMIMSEDIRKNCGLRGKMITEYDPADGKLYTISVLPGEGAYFECSTFSRDEEGSSSNYYTIRYLWQRDAWQVHNQYTGYDCDGRMDRDFYNITKGEENFDQERVDEFKKMDPDNQQGILYFLSALSENDPYNKNTQRDHTAEAAGY